MTWINDLGRGPTEIDSTNANRILGFIRGKKL